MSRHAARRNMKRYRSMPVSPPPVRPIGAIGRSRPRSMRGNSPPPGHSVPTASTCSCHEPRAPVLAGRASERAVSMSAASGGKLSNDFSNRSADRWQLCSTSNEQQRAVGSGQRLHPKKSQAPRPTRMLGRNNSHIELNESLAPALGHRTQNRAGKVLCRRTCRDAPSGPGTARSNGVPANACGRVADRFRRRCFDPAPRTPGGAYARADRDERSGEEPNHGARATKTSSRIDRRGRR